MSIRDTFAQPRCTATSLRLPVGAWEYRTEADPVAQAALILLGWRKVGATLFKYTHREVVE